MSKEPIILANKADCLSLIAKFNEHFSAPEAKPMKLVLTICRPQRSSQQNRYYWGVALEKALDYFKQNPVNLIKFVLSAISAEFLSKEFLHEVCKMKYLKGESTTDNDTVDQNEYADELRGDMYHLYQVDIPLPNQPPLNQLTNQGENYVVSQ